MGSAYASAKRYVLDPRDVHGSFIDETIAIVARQARDMVSFAVGSPAVEALHLVGVEELARAVLSREPARALGYGITEGDPELRELIAADARRCSGRQGRLACLRPSPADARVGPHPGHAGR